VSVTLPGRRRPTSGRDSTRFVCKPGGLNSVGNNIYSAHDGFRAIRLWVLLVAPGLGTIQRACSSNRTFNVVDEFVNIDSRAAFL